MRLTKEDIIAIRTSKDSQKVLAKKYGVSQGTVSAIKRRVVYKYLRNDGVILKKPPGKKGPRRFYEEAPEAPLLSKDQLERLWSLINKGIKPDECWFYEGSDLPSPLFYYTQDGVKYHISVKALMKNLVDGVDGDTYHRFKFQQPRCGIPGCVNPNHTVVKEIE